MGLFFRSRKNVRCRERVFACKKEKDFNRKDRKVTRGSQSDGNKSGRWRDDFVWDWAVESSVVDRRGRLFVKRTCVSHLPGAVFESADPTEVR